MCLIKNKVLVGKGLWGFLVVFSFFFFGAILTECIYIISISLIIVVTITTLHEKYEFKQYITSEVILVLPSLLSPVITFLKLNLIKKITKGKSQRLTVLLSLRNMLFLLLLSSNKDKQALFYLTMYKKNSLNLKISAIVRLWDECLFGSLSQTENFQILKLFCS